VPSRQNASLVTGVLNGRVHRLLDGSARAGAGAREVILSSFRAGVMRLTEGATRPSASRTPTCRSSRLGRHQGGRPSAALGRGTVGGHASTVCCTPSRFAARVRASGAASSDGPPLGGTWPWRSKVSAYSLEGARPVGRPAADGPGRGRSWGLDFRQRRRRPGPSTTGWACSKGGGFEFRGPVPGRVIWGPQGIRVNLVKRRAPTAAMAAQEHPGPSKRFEEVWTEAGGAPRGGDLKDADPIAKKPVVALLLPTGSPPPTVRGRCTSTAGFPRSRRLRGAALEGGAGPVRFVGGDVAALERRTTLTIGGDHRVRRPTVTSRPPSFPTAVASRVGRIASSNRPGKKTWAPRVQAFCVRWLDRSGPEDPDGQCDRRAERTTIATGHGPGTRVAGDPHQHDGRKSLTASAERGRCSSTTRFAIPAFPGRLATARPRSTWLSLGHGGGLPAATPSEKGPPSRPPPGVATGSGLAQQHRPVTCPREKSEAKQARRTLRTRTCPRTRPRRAGRSRCARPPAGGLRLLDASGCSRRLEICRAGSAAPRDDGGGRRSRAITTAMAAPTSTRRAEETGQLRPGRRGSSVDSFQHVQVCGFRRRRAGRTRNLAPARSPEAAAGGRFRRRGQARRRRARRPPTTKVRSPSVVGTRNRRPFNSAPPGVPSRPRVPRGRGTTSGLGRPRRTRSRRTAC